MIDDPSPSISSRHTGNMADRLARKQDDMRRWANGLVSIGYEYAVEDLIAGSSQYSYVGGPP